MDALSLPIHTAHPPRLSSAAPAAARRRASSVNFSLRPPHEPDPEPEDSASGPSTSKPIRRPRILKQSPPSSSPAKPRAKIPKNPLKRLVNPSHLPDSITTTATTTSLSNKLWLSSKLAPPPPPSPPPPPPPPPELVEDDVREGGSQVSGDSDSNDAPATIDYRQLDKIFVGNLPNWIKKNEVAEFFRQFGPIKNVILIKGHNETERNAGFGFVIYSGPTAAKSAMKAVEFDGVEFHGRVLTVKLDDGRRLKVKSEERLRYVDGNGGVEFRTKWHEEREGSRNAFRTVLETEPENWQAVVSAFERIKKV